MIRRRALTLLCAAAVALFILLTTFTSADDQPAPATAPSAAQIEPGELESRLSTRSLETELAFAHPRVESRGVWIPSNDLLGPRDALLAKLDAIRKANFNTVLVDVWFRGYTAYAGSAVAPMHPALNGEDVFATVLREAHARGLRVEPWFSYGFYAYFTPDAGKDRSVGPVLTAHPSLFSVDADGARRIHRSFGDYYSLCPANPQSHAILAKLMLEAVTKYPVDGLHLDRMRFADGSFCFCDYCRQHFASDAGYALEPFANDSPQHERWTQWKRMQTLAAVRHITSVIRAHRPALPITAYVVGPNEMDARGQSWDLWAQEGLVDAVAVSMYAADIRPAARKALERLSTPAARSRLICAISTSQIPTPIYAANVQVARQFSSLGQFTWYLDALDEADLAALKSGPYANRATDPLAR
jgi:uncharacterized lipoprotein YddW (UPF0748 family)